jgi:hypothetical protein
MVGANKFSISLTQQVSFAVIPNFSHVNEKVIGAKINEKF